MKLKYLLAASVVSLSATAMVAAPASAQQITSGIEGQVTDADGAAISGATVVVTDTRTGRASTLTADTNGSFRVSSLVPGGPYTITATAAGFEGQSVEGQFITVSGNTDFKFELATATDGGENFIVVTGERANVQQLAVGPGSAFSTETLESFPSLTRDIRDIIRIDPRVSLDRDNDVDRISCLGGNDRSNTFTVDGITQADVFGLNGTPFAARNALPLPFDVVRETSVEFAPFDVEYSDFTGCLVNVVTKSGSNKFSGSAFFTYFDEGLQADEIDGRPLNAGREKRWGATLGGPIIPDRLFFFAGYEETDLGGGNNFGPAGGGFTNEADFVTQAQFDQFAEIANRVYGQDVGGYPTQLAEASVRYFGRLDAYINDDHRLEATYQRLEETNVEADVGGQNLTGLNSFEDEGTLSDYYSVRLYSDWSDKVSTELRVSRAEVGDVQGPVGFGEAQSANPTVRLAVGVAPVAGQTDENGILSTGPGIFRSANQLDTKIDQARFIMKIAAGDHNIKLGAEINDLEVFNLFAINATGTLYFQNLADFENGLVANGFFSTGFGNADRLANGVLGGGAIASTATGNIADAAARFNRTIYSVYAQNDWQATPQLDVTAGLRVQWFDGDAPTINPNFVDRYGFSNSVPFSTLDPILLPRLAATYEFENTGFLSNSSFTAGGGIFSGGDPIVFFSNAFADNGFASANGTTFDCAAGQLPIDAATGQIDVVTGGTFTGLPQCATDAASARAAAGGANVNSVNPDFKTPTVTRLNAGFATDIGTETGFFSGFRLNVDYIYSRFNNPIDFIDLASGLDTSRGLNGFTVDGRPLYSQIDPSTAGCNATLTGNNGTAPPYTNLSPACFTNGRENEIQLTNGDAFESHAFSVLLSKNFRRGIFTEGGGVSFRLGYAFTDSKNNREQGSSRAVSNYGGTAAFDRQNVAQATSGFETRHNITAAVNFREEFFGDYKTALGIFFRAAEGRPYSLTFDNDSIFDVQSSGGDNALLYIPTGINDPNLSPSSTAADVASLVDYLANNEAAQNCDFTPGQTIARNTCRNDWFFDVDMRISQELPFIGSLTGIANDRVEFFMDVDNFLNLIDSGANVRRSRGDLVDLVDGGVDAQGRYIISGFRPDDDNDIFVSNSRWRLQVGVRYEF